MFWWTMIVFFSICLISSMFWDRWSLCQPSMFRRTAIRHCHRPSEVSSVHAEWRNASLCRCTVYQRHRSISGIPALFSNAYWHRNARVIEIQTRQQLNNNFFLWNSEFLWTDFEFGHLAANVRVRCSDFSKLPVYAVYSNRRPPSLFGEHCVILRPTWRVWKMLKRW